MNVESMLLTHSIKPTAARMFVLRQFRGQEIRTPEEIYAKLSADQVPVSMCTVYATLATFHRARLLDRFLSGPHNRASYTLARKACPIRITCTVCGANTSLESQSFVRTLETHLESLEFEPTEVTLRVGGLCKDCRRIGRPVRRSG